MIKVSDYIVSRLADHGIRHVFMLTGGGAMHLNDSLGKESRLQYVCNHHEQASAIAAEGYARTSGTTGAVCVTTGPGGTNAVTGVLGQWLDSIPAILSLGAGPHGDDRCPYWLALATAWRSRGRHRRHRAFDHKICGAHRLPARSVIIWKRPFIRVQRAARPGLARCSLGHSVGHGR